MKKTALLLCAITLSCVLNAQVKTPVQVMGKKKGSIEMIKEDGQSYVAAMQMAKALGLKTTWFGKSGQLNITVDSAYFAVLRDAASHAMINGEPQSLPTPSIMRGGRLYTPVEFFEGGSFPKAVKRDIIFDPGKITVRNYSGQARPAIRTADVKKAEPVILQAPPKATLEVPTVITTVPAKITPAISAAPTVKNRKMRVMIDAGHGGQDPGAVRSGVREKSINLKVAQQVAALLKKERNVEVKLTRPDDTFIALGRRAELANQFKADVFVSIHGNAAKRAGANGFEVYFRSDKASDAEAAATAALENEALSYEGKSNAKVSFADLLLKSLADNEYMNESSKLASHIRNAVSANARSVGIKVYEKSSVKQANFYVLKGVEAPSVLVELGYISNSNDRKKLNTSSAQNKLAQYIKNGVMSYAKAEGWK